MPLGGIKSCLVKVCFEVPPEIIVVTYTFEPKIFYFKIR